ncbi:hypothetical protein ACTXT7_005937 [Hymenolepis weldensis]
MEAVSCPQLNPNQTTMTVKATVYHGRGKVALNEWDMFGKLEILLRPLSILSPAGPFRCTQQTLLSHY